MKNNLLKLVTLGLVTGALVMPMTINAQSKSQREIDRRQKTKGDWQKTANISGAAALLGLVTHNKTLTYVGAGTSLYSVYRMQEDTKSQNRTRRNRAAFYNQTHYTHKGVRYDRKTVHKNGHTYYTFVKHRG
jgi:hypothetical protein